MSESFEALSDNCLNIFKAVSNTGFCVGVGYGF